MISKLSQLLKTKKKKKYRKIKNYYNEVVRKQWAIIILFGVYTKYTYLVTNSNKNWYNAFNYKSEKKNV